MDFRHEERECFISHYYLDDETHQKILEIIERDRTTTNKHRARGLLDWPDSIEYKGYIAQIELVGEIKLEPKEDIKG